MKTLPACPGNHLLEPGAPFDRVCRPNSHIVSNRQSLLTKLVHFVIPIVGKFIENGLRETTGQLHERHQEARGGDVSLSNRSQFLKFRIRKAGTRIALSSLT